MSIEHVQSRWPTVVEVLFGLDEQAGALARNGVPTAVDYVGRQVVVTFEYPVHAHMMAKAERKAVLEWALAEVLGGVWQVRFESPLDRRDQPGATVGTEQDEVRFVYSVGFPKDVEQRLEAEAIRRGVNPIQLIRDLVTAALPPGSRS